MVDEVKPFTQHLDELRSRIIVSVIAVLIASLSSWYLVDYLLQVLVKPVGKFVFIAPQEAFLTYLTLSVYAGVFFAFPFILWQIWRFVSVALEKHEKKSVLIYAPFSYLLFLAGCSFAFFLIIPLGTKFLLGFSSNIMDPMISVKSYISFASMLILGFGLVFQMPIVILFLSGIGIVRPRLLREKRKVIIVLIFITAAVLTPPDVVTQLLMAGPMIFLYEISIILSQIIYRKNT